MKNFLRSAETVLIPKGDARRASIEAFQSVADIEVPTFTDEQLSVESEGRMFVLVKSKDVPGLVSRGLADIGLTGTDSIMESTVTNLRAKRLADEAMCRFSLLSRKGDLAYWRRGFDGDWDGMVRKKWETKVLTSYPNLVSKLAQSTGFLFSPMDIEVSGSVEGVAKLIKDESFIVADIVDTGKTSQQNGLTEFRKLIDIYPEVVFVDQLSGTIEKGKS